MHDLRSEIAARNEAFRVATERGDPAALAALYTEDAWLLPHGRSMIQGRRDIEAFWRSRLERIAEVRLTTDDVVSTGQDTAREIGRSAITLKQAPTPIAGKYLVCWKRVADEWQLEADAFNGDC